MARYFFHIMCPDIAPITDNQGAEFADLEGAKAEATQSIRALFADAVKRGGRADGFAIQITDEKGKYLARVKAEDAID